MLGGMPTAHEDFVHGLATLGAADFDDLNPAACGPERLDALMRDFETLTDRGAAMPFVFAFLERLADADLGSPGPIVHTLESLGGYEAELQRSLARKPTTLALWMSNRILNALTDPERRAPYLELLSGAIAHPEASSEAQETAARFLRRQQPAS